MHLSSGSHLVNEARGRDRLLLTLELEVELPVREVVDEQEWAERLGCQNFRDQRRAGEVAGSRGEVEIELAHLAQRPAAGNRDAPAVGGSARLVHDAELGPEDVCDLVVGGRLNGLLERDEVRPQLPKALQQDSAARGPVAMLSPDIERGDAQEQAIHQCFSMSLAANGRLERATL